MLEVVPLTVNEVHASFAKLARDILERSDVRIDSVHFSWVEPFGGPPILLGVSLDSESSVAQPLGDSHD